MFILLEYYILSYIRGKKSLRMLFYLIASQSLHRFNFLNYITSVFSFSADKRASNTIRDNFACARKLFSS